MRRTSARSDASTTSVSQSGSAADAPARPGDARHLREHARGIVDVLEHALGAHDVEAAVGERQRVRVADVKLDIHAIGRGAPGGLGDERFRHVDADGGAARPDDRRHRAHVVAGAAADVERAHPVGETERAENAPLVRLHRFDATDRIEIDHERARIAGAVDILEARPRGHEGYRRGSSHGFPGRMGGDPSPRPLTQIRGKLSHLYMRRTKAL